MSSRSEPWTTPQLRIPGKEKLHLETQRTFIKGLKLIEIKRDKTETKPVRWVFCERQHVLQWHVANLF